MLSPYVHVAICGSNEIMVKHGSRSRFSHIVRDHAGTRLLGRVLRILREPLTVADILTRGSFADHERQDIENLVDRLLRENVLIHSDGCMLDAYFPIWLGDAPESTNGRTVGILGCGLLGSHIARHLLNADPKELVLLDGRRMSPLDAQVLRLRNPDEVLGVPYGEALAARLRERGYSRVRTVDAPLADTTALEDLYGACDFVAVALDSFSPFTLHRINAVALRQKRPWLCTYMDGSDGVIGPLYVPGETGCYNEFEIQNEATASLKTDYLTFKESLEADTNDTLLSGCVMSPFRSIVAGWASTAALAFLMTGKSFLLDRCLRVDFERFSVDRQDVLRLPRCPACAELRVARRHTFL